MTYPTKILYLANASEIIGGGQISLLQLIEKIDKKKFCPVVICPEAGGLSEEFEKMNVETYMVKMETLRKLNIFSWIKSVASLKKIIKRDKIEIIHCNGSRAALFGGIAARLSKVPMIWHVRIADCDKLLDRVLVRLSTKIVTISKAVKRRFDHLKIDENRFELIYNGIDLDRFKPDLNRKNLYDEFKIKSKGALVGMVGRLDWYKGHTYLVDAVRIVTERFPDVHVLIVGDGEKRDQLEEQVEKLKLTKNITFTGNRNDIPQILASIDLFVLSSVSEGFGRAAAEAMACAKPVVGTTAGGLPEVVENGKTGLLVPPKNPSLLAEAIITIVGDKEKREVFGNAGRSRVEALFNSTSNVKSTETLYDSILSM